MSEFAGVAQTVVAWERGCPQFATPGVGTNGRTPRGLSSRVNGEVREEQTVRARSANSLVGLLFWVQAHRRSLGFPGFPVESCGFEQLHVVLFEENHMQWHR